MNTKLTLRMNDDVIERMKRFSERHKVSLSKLTELIFTNIVSYENDIEYNLSPITKKYKGIISGNNFSEDSSKYNYLIEKNK